MSWPARGHYRSPGDPGAGGRRHVGWAVDWPTGHAIADTLTVVREINVRGRPRWVVVTTIRCKCGAVLRRDSPPRTRDPRLEVGGVDTHNVERMHSDHCLAVAGRRPRRMLLAGPIRNPS